MIKDKRPYLPANTSLKEKEILLLIAQGDKEAYRKIFDDYWPGIYSLGLKMTKSPEQAKDLAQDVFAKLWIHRLQLSKLDNFQAFLFTIARNTIRDFLRKRVFDSLNDAYISEYLSTQPITIVRPFEEVEKKQTIEAAINRLPPQIQRAFRLRHQNFSHDEIAKQMNISRVTSKSYVVKALELLRGYLSDQTVVSFLIFLAVNR